MPIDTTPSTVATSALQGIPFSSLIGGPLNAAIDAQVNAAKSTVDFIQNVGLTGPPENRRPIQVEFIYYVDGRETKLMVPLLTIVPIPYLAVDEVEIKFKASINASASTHQEDSSSSETKGSGSLDVAVGYGPFSAKAHFEGSYSSKKDSKATQDSKYSVEYTMDVLVHASQESMPAGLAKVLNILEQSIAPTEATATIRFLPERLEITGGEEKTYKIKAIVYDDKGRRVKNTAVTLTAFNVPNKGTIMLPTTATTDGNGEAELSLTYNPQGTDGKEYQGTIEFTAGEAKKKFNVLITPSKALPPTNPPTSTP
jgi:hypothetical protein